MTKGLSKSYRTGHVIQGRRPALQDLDLEVRTGEIFGYVGPNGSGKTTTLKLLIGLLKPDRGRRPGAGRAARVALLALPHGVPPGAPLPLRLPDAGRVPRVRGPALRPGRAASAASGPGELLALVGLERSADLPLRRFSKGMVQRAGLAQALVNDPELVILDEPMSGLDPIGRRLVRDIILGLRKAGKTVFFSTHILSDAEALCDRVAVLRGGPAPQGRGARRPAPDRRRAHGDLRVGRRAGRPRARRDAAGSGSGTGCASRWRSASSAGP